MVALGFGSCKPGLWGQFGTLVFGTAIISWGLGSLTACDLMVKTSGSKATGKKPASASAARWTFLTRTNCAFGVFVSRWFQICLGVTW